MKKKIGYITIILSIMLLSIWILSGKVEAATTYNSEIAYNENWDGETVTVVANGKYIESATIPSTINGKKVIKIEGFEDCTYLKTVSIPSTVTTIEWGAFRNCTSLTNITIPNSVTSIESYAFEGCTKLTKITIPSSVTKLDRGAFMGCTNLQTVTLNKGLKLILREVFANCSNLRNITIPETVTEIQWGAFENCTSLTSITIPSNVTKLGGNWYEEGIFAGCTSLKTAIINAKATELPEGMFYNCKALTTIKLSDTFTNMGRCVFANCTSLTSIVLPENLTNIGENAFANCSKLSNVQIKDKVEVIKNQAFENCTSLVSLKIPYGVKTIEADGYEASYSDGPFKGCTKLRTLYFTKSIQEIGTAAFQGLTPSNITFYGYAGTAAKYYAQEHGMRFVECVPVSSIKITGASSVLKGSTVKLTATISPTNAYNKEVSWASSNTKVATVDANGTVKGINEGTTTITAKAKDGTGVSTNYTVKVILTELPYQDINVNHWAYSAVKYCTQKGIIKGTTNTKFSPEEKLTRGMLVTILHRMEGTPYVAGNSKFSDVRNTQDYYYMAVKWATQNNIVSGYNDGRFGPNDNITREQLAVILNKYSRYKGKYKAQANILKNFSDANKISSFAIWEMQWATGAGVITGSNGKLNPQGTTTRAEAASMLYKYCLNIK